MTRPDGYTGDVTPGGPPDVHELPGLRITKLSVGDFDNNVYLLRCARTGDTVLVDAATDAERILSFVGDGRLTTVVQTHGHWDHVRAINDVVAATGARLVCHRYELPLMPEGSAPDPVDDGARIPVGANSVRGIHLCGHTPGGLALLYDADGALADSPHLISGDSLFPGGPGNTEKDPARFARLMDDLEAKVFGPLPDATWIYPGHGKDTTLGAERPSIPEWRTRGW
ncbi:MAG TPA: MBL fold metallo-hydrolase [Mycobacteriales bacterium]|nr:MBL fold metallo-hydrolase [Mycobacteriales bacterium]